LETLPQIIENSARSHPEREAFRFGSKALAYSELEHRMHQLADHLIRIGVKKGDRVGVYMNRCIETAIAIYGIMRAGGVYVPLDAMTPHSRTLFLLKDCSIAHIVSTRSQKKRLTSLLTDTMVVESVIGVTLDLNIKSISWDNLFENNLENYQPVAIGPDDLAYIMYTSGSTGPPKGIMHTHFSGLSYARLSADLYGVHHLDRFASHAPLHFDISTFGFFTVPYAGATSIILSDAHVKMPFSLAQLLEKEQITIWYSVPLALIQLLQGGFLEQKDLKSIRWVLFGGENFALKYLKTFTKLWPHATFCNVYGPAEVNQCTYHNVVPDDLNSNIPIGEVWSDTSFKIMDKNYKEVDDGITGQLLIQSVTMMRGYWNNDALTKKSTYIEKVTPTKNNIYYCTGDMVYKNEYGKLVFVGRNDRQVKIRGYRIEMNEVESILLRHEGVQEAAVFVIEKEEGVKILAAALLLFPLFDIDSKMMTKFCRGLLPQHSIPTMIEVLPYFPRTSSGKIDRPTLLNRITDKLIDA
tara:strand:- start:107880 stop:109451 length:1572 start_codon:yes stop_codon:yes gene_type:complete